VRAQLRGIPVVLGSATPSLESRENAARGKYTLLRMTKRVEARPLPEADVIDLRKEKAEKEDKGFVIFSGSLKSALRGVFDAGEVLHRDSTRKKGELVRILDRFRSQTTQALIGTQMLSKGHHFPNVTLTAVLSADSILGYPDFRSAEKTFYLLTQVAGRSGRGAKRGKVLIQTAFPTHYAIQHALRHDYEAFFESEIQFRRTFHYPPVTAMIAILFRGE